MRISSNTLVFRKCEKYDIVHLIFPNIASFIYKKVYNLQDALFAQNALIWQLNCSVTQTVYISCYSVSYNWYYRKANKGLLYSINWTLSEMSCCYAVLHEQQLKLQKYLGLTDILWAKACLEQFRPLQIVHHLHLNKKGLVTSVYRNSTTGKSVCVCVCVGSTYIYIHTHAHLYINTV